MKWCDENCRSKMLDCEEDSWENYDKNKLALMVLIKKLMTCITINNDGGMNMRVYASLWGGLGVTGAEGEKQLVKELYFGRAVDSLRWSK